MSRLRRVAHTARRWWHEGPRDPRWRRWLFAVAAAAFVVAAVLAYRAHPIDPGEVRWPVLAAVAVLGVPATILSNAEEYRTMAWMAGRRVPFGEAVRVTVLALAANLLPVPGGVVVRLRELNRAGLSAGRTFSVTAVVGAAWVGMTGVLAGGLLLGRTDDLGAAALAVGAGLLLGAFGGWWRLRHAVLEDGVTGGTGATFVRLLAVEAASVLAGAVRLFGVLVALRLEGSFAQATGLTVSGVIATFAGIFPGGLGIRELAAGAISPLVDLPAATGLLASVGNRVVEYAVMVPVAVVAVRSVRQRRERAT